MKVLDLLSEYQEVYFVKMAQSCGRFTKCLLEGKGEKAVLKSFLRS